MRRGGGGKTIHFFFIIILFWILFKYSSISIYTSILDPHKNPKSYTWSPELTRTLGTVLRRVCWMTNKFSSLVCCMTNLVLSHNFFLDTDHQLSDTSVCQRYHFSLLSYDIMTFVTRKWHTVMIYRVTIFPQYYK